MKIGILFFRKEKGSKENDSIDQLVRCVEKNNHEASIINISDIILRFGEKTEIFLNDKPFPIFDCIIYRPKIISDPSIPCTYLRALKNQGQNIINGDDSTKNKIEKFRLLSDYGVAVPRTSVIYNKNELDNAIKEFEFPIIVKTTYGSCGTGVFYAESFKSLKPIVEFLFKRIPYNDPVTIQEFISEANNSDIRAFVVGDKVVAAMKRTAPHNDVRANFSGGGSVEIYSLSKEEEDIALMATRATCLDYSGVDIILSKRGPLVLEVNSSPGFDGIREATGVDVADKIVQYSTLKFGV